MNEWREPPKVKQHRAVGAGQRKKPEGLVAIP